MKILPLFFTLLFISIVPAQIIDFSLALEAGVGYNLLFVDYNPLPEDVALYDKLSSRTEMSVTQTYRLSAKFNYFGDFLLLPFAGYTQFGGRSDRIDDPDFIVYQDEYIISAYEIGVMFGYPLKKWHFLAGYKHKLHTIAKIKFPALGQQEVDITSDFPTHSGNFGLRVEYIVGFASVVAEAWFGLPTKFRGSGFGPGRADSLNETHFRLLLSFHLLDM